MQDIASVDGVSLADSRVVAEDNGAVSVDEIFELVLVI